MVQQISDCGSNQRYVRGANDVPLQWITDGLGVFVEEGNELPVRVFKVNLETGQHTDWKERIHVSPPHSFRLISGTWFENSNLFASRDSLRNGC